MKSKEEILDHLSKTVYTHNARRSIVQWMLQRHIVDYKCQIMFANHVYNRDGERMTEGLSFEDFIEWVHQSADKVKIQFDELWGYHTAQKGFPYPFIPFRYASEETANELAKAVKKKNDTINADWTVSEHKIIVDDFHIGDVVKYIPDPDNTSDEYVEAIAHDTEGHAYLCLSNGEWVKPCYCVKYKYQGDERRALIDKLNEVI